MTTKTDKTSEWSINDTIFVTPWAKAGIYFDLVMNEATGFFMSIKLGLMDILQHIASENIIEKHLPTLTDAPEMVHATESISFIIETYHCAYHQVDKAKLSLSWKHHFQTGPKIKNGRKWRRQKTLLYMNT